jgi:hypothetical protein
VLRTLLVVLASSSLALDSAGGQAPPVTWPPLSQLSASSLYAEQPTTPFDAQRLAGEPSDTVARQIKPTFWKEGGLVGGIASGVFMALFAHGMCAYAEGNTRDCGLALLGGTVVGGGLGFALGALVGGQFSKGRPPASRD